MSACSIRKSMVQFPAVEYGRSSCLTLVMLMGRFSISRGVDVRRLNTGLTLGVVLLFVVRIRRRPEVG